MPARESAEWLRGFTAAEEDRAKAEAKNDDIGFGPYEGPEDHSAKTGAARRNEPVEAAARARRCRRADFAAAFKSLQGMPSNSESLREIAQASMRCALMWIDALAQLTGPIDDAALVEIARDMAAQQLADIRAKGDRLNFKFPQNRLN
jgi:hypothetical protein